ncbi:hypothetical protein ZF26_001836 [Salmonella enterica subsp. enterica]|nr:hypothetical protein [Salmonella enterica subsp. enterica serovar Saintpaul]EBW5583948.1 hypothetical protein [Salmonella enterica subsp. enterica serovar Enteritidis]EDQ2528125.1 hypothetical protein [Salmonella enterica subsp. enterica]EBU9661642.1 hypothetical protein [Salmonella enterica subsp. enterica serovar Saintpaul]EBW3339139.1 hypothetical protein [Salmonella enterica subsp. enterica serovar Saintpaul]
MTFKRLDLVENMNDIVAKHYPGRCPQNKRYLRNKLHQEFLAY